MPYEVECGECHKQILIEDLGVEVSCPYCQTTLILTAKDLAGFDQQNQAGDSHVVISEEASFDYNFSESSSSIGANGGSDSHVGGSGVSSAVLDDDDSEAEQQLADEQDSVPDFNFLKTPGEDATLDSDEPETREDLPNFSFTDPAAETSTETPATPPVEAPVETELDIPNFNFTEPAAAGTSDVSSISIEISEPAPKESDKKQTPAEKTRTKSRKRTAPEEEASPAAGSVYARKVSTFSPRFTYSLISYSILVTIAFLYLLMKFNTAKPHQLESLPDIAPPAEGEFHLIRENALLAPGHTLRIGESQRFGNIRITPLKVTRAPLQFQHFQNRALGGGLRPTQPVLKLWLEIQNVSEDQVFPPLDLELLTKREHNPDDYKLIHAHNWVCRQSDLKSRSHRILMFNHPSTSEYDITGLITRPLKPGETIQTFLPTQEEDLGELTGPLVWRFQIRKGFNPRSMNGVTTLVEVKFSSDDVRSEST